MKKQKLIFALTAVLLSAVAAVCVAQEADLIAVLKSDAGHQEKAAACRQLARVGTQEAVPTLAAMLGDEKLAHMARTALETIPGPAADDALRAALNQLEGRLLMGAMGSLGVRRDAQAVGPLAQRLADRDADVAQAAARALGQIGTAEAAAAIDAALAKTPAANQVAFCEGLFRCAEALSAAGQAATSQAICDRLRNLSPAPHQVRAGALRGAILARQNEGLPLMLEAIRGGDWILTAAAARTAMEMPSKEVTAALAGELPKLPADKQLLLVTTLGQRGDAAAGPALLALASQGEPAVRLAAVRNLTHLAYAPALTLLGELSLSGEGELAAAARDCLGSFPGKEADAAILAMLTDQDAKVRGLAVEMIGLRSVPGATASLVKAAADEEESVRLAALRALRDQAGAAELPALLKLLVQARSSAESQAAENALGSLVARQSGPASGNVVIVKAEYGNLPEGPSADVTAKVAAMVKEGAMAIDASNGNFGDPAQGIAKRLRIDYTVNGVPASKTVREQESLTFTATFTPPALVEAISGAIAAAPVEAKLALLRTLRSAGGAKALETVNAAATNGEGQVQDTALRVLCDWPTPDALPIVAELVKSPPTPTVKILALRAFVRLVPQQDASDAQKVDSLKDAMGQAERAEEKRLVLSALGNVPAAAALALVTSHLADPVLKEEACLAAVAIAEKLVPRHKAEVAAAMKQVIQATANEKLAAKAKGLANQAKP
jgi:HEAT repeat protein